MYLIARTHDAKTPKAHNIYIYTYNIGPYVYVGALYAGALYIYICIYVSRAPYIGSVCIQCRYL